VNININVITIIRLNRRTIITHLRMHNSVGT